MAASSVRSLSKILSGVLAPIPTPFSADSNSINYSALESNLTCWLDCANGLDGLVVMGSNGEFPFLDDNERLELLTHVSKFVRSTGSKIRLIAGTGACSTRQAIHWTNIAAKLKYDAALVVTPYYYTSRMTDDLLKRHYLTLADAVDLPLALYNMPLLAGGVSIGLELVTELAKHPRIIGIKDSSGNLENMYTIYQATKDQDFSVLAGSANYFHRALQAGASGGVMALSSVLGSSLKAIHAMHQSGYSQQATELQAILVDINSAITSKFSVPGLKYALELIGLYGGPTRLPLQPLTDENRDYIQYLLRKSIDEFNRVRRSHKTTQSTSTAVPST